MTADTRGVRRALYVLFTVSGFAGLIYESIWAHYLKLMLGHAAYAQTLVLILFMGGMAIGAGLCGRYAERLRNPLMLYAIVEGLLGLGALAFDPLFRGVHALVLDTLAPALGGSPWAVEATKWSAATLLVLPPCILLGATFPLISAAVVRLSPQDAGRTLGWLYFTNSFGAVAGVLTSGFVLISAVGLPGTLLTACLINFVLAISVYGIAKYRDPGPALTAAAVVQTSGAGAPDSAKVAAASLPLLLLIVTFGSSAASFLYEIGWIRMLTMVLGAATQSFELMLAAFILGLALGAFAIRNRADGLREPVYVLAWVQILMGTLALCTLAIYDDSFTWMARLMASVSHTEAGWPLFLTGSALICVAMMLPVTICAGMTLPLITTVLLRRGYGEGSIGRVYAANTWGAIAGVIVAVHVIMPLLGLRAVVVAGGLLDLALGAWLLTRAGVSITGWARIALPACVVLALGLAVMTRFDEGLQASGVFRYSQVKRRADVVYRQDGKTATVHVFGQLDSEKGRAIATNGKIDASVSSSRATPDDYTMTLTAIIPMSMHPQAREVAVIGFGSGRTTHTLLQNPRLERVDTIEIEPAMVEGARLFGPLVAAAYEDPRSAIHIDDAKTFFARHGAQYDLIISEPSNPWVSGVASLFTREFYAQAKRHVRPGGYFVQWVHTYEMELGLVATIMGALAAEFSDFVVYASNEGDTVIVASPDGRVPPPGEWVFGEPSLARMMEPMGIETVEGVRVRHIGSKNSLMPWFAAMRMPPNSDFFPVLDQNATRARFVGARATDVLTVMNLTQRIDGVPLDARALAYSPTPPMIGDVVSARLAVDVVGWVTGERPPGDLVPSAGVIDAAAALGNIRTRCVGPEVERVWLPTFQGFLLKYGPWLHRDHAATLLAALRQNRCEGERAAYVGSWLDFLEAIAARDYPRTRDLGTALVAKEQELKHRPSEALIRELLLADLMTGGPAAVRARFAALGEHLPLPPPATLLYLRSWAGLAVEPEAAAPEAGSARSPESTTSETPQP